MRNAKPYMMEDLGPGMSFDYCSCSHYFSDCKQDREAGDRQTFGCTQPEPVTHTLTRMVLTSLLDVESLKRSLPLAVLTLIGIDVMIHSSCAVIRSLSRQSQDPHPTSPKGRGEDSSRY